MKKTIALLLALVMTFALFVTGCGQSEDKPADDTKKTFTVGFDAEYPPYGYVDEETNDYTGFDLELAQAVCDIEGWELVKTPINWDTKDDTLNAGEIDVIWNGFTMTGRESEYQWSNAYVDNSQVIVTSKTVGITKLEELKGKIVGVQQGSAALALFEDEGDQVELAATFGDLQQFADYNTAFTELESGAIEALAIDIGVAQYQIKSRGDAFYILDEELSTEQYAVGAKLGNTELIDIINKDLKTLYDNGTVQKLAEKYDIATMIIPQK